MRIVLASSEALPFAKTGGLADVSSALPKSLASLGHQVTLILPFHRQSAGTRDTVVEPVAETLEVPIGPKQVCGRLLRTRFPDSAVDVLFVDQPLYFDRPDLYHDHKLGQDYRDNCERFVFFSRAVLEAVRLLGLNPDVIHANDWQTGLVPALLQIEYRYRPEFAATAAVFTIHNIAFQGNFWHWDMLLTGLDWKYFNWRQMEYFGNVSLLKTGIVFADMVTTVSPSYAREIQTEAFGGGMQGVLRSHRDKLVGILNGIDPDIWNPATDKSIPHNYNVDTAAAGKAACKRALQEKLGLPVQPETPLFGMISRMTDQKGFDLVAACAHQMLALDLQLAFLGTGDEKYETMLTGLAHRHRDKVSTTVGFDEALSHQIEAGADAYLMPSRFEPCGLNQMYSLAYGTVPVVRSVGGLADSVVDAKPENLQNGTANGFSFEDYEPQQLVATVQRAVDAYNSRDVWKQLVETGMRQDWSWNRSAADYVAAYQRAVNNARGAAAHA